MGVPSIFEPGFGKRPLERILFFQKPDMPKRCAGFFIKQRKRPFKCSLRTFAQTGTFEQPLNQNKT
ncbi:MAG: hypothetical protein D6714_06850 [Bacteroidetes bacterium]|nr:MAG: hypothetical protein D6714_06850 [Bacteroidota bacterium]